MVTYTYLWHSISWGIKHCIGLLKKTCGAKGLSNEGANYIKVINMRGSVQLGYDTGRQELSISDMDGLTECRVAKDGKLSSLSIVH